MKDCLLNTLNSNTTAILDWSTDVIDLLSQAEKNYTLLPGKILDENSTKMIVSMAEDVLCALYDIVTKILINKKVILLVNFPQSVISNVEKITQKCFVDSVYLYDGPENNNLDVALKSEKLINAFGVKNKKDITNIKKCIEAKTAIDLDVKYTICKDIAVAGLDVSMSNTGIAAVAANSDRELILIGSLSSKPGKGDFFRGKDAEHALKCLPMRDKFLNNYLVDMTSCKSFCIEGGALDANQGAYRIGRYCGMLMGVFDIKDLEEIAPNRLKLFVTGYGKSPKEYVAEMACKKMDFPSNAIYKNDESDALALLYSKLNLDKLNMLYPIKTKKAKKKPALGGAG